MAACVLLYGIRFQDYTFALLDNYHKFPYFFENNCNSGARLVLLMWLLVVVWLGLALMVLRLCIQEMSYNVFHGISSIHVQSIYNIKSIIIFLSEN